MRMKIKAITALVCGLAAVPALNAQIKDAAVAVAETEAVVTVIKVDPKARTVTFRGPKGGVATLHLPPESQNINQVKPGQRYRMTYVESVAVEIHKGGKPSAGATQQVKVAAKGAKPGGMMVNTRQISGVIDAIDFTNRYVAIRGPQGNTVALKVADDVKLEALSAGDRIVVTYTEALAVEMVAQAPAKKPGAKKAK
jgi:Cu/Ag efflux protein CusF